jgi:hypothetical protein
MTWVTTEYRKEREAYYKAEALKKLAGSEGVGTDAVLQYFREEERRAQRRTRSGLRLAGLITGSVGIGSMVFLYAYAPLPDQPVYLAGLIPTLVGAALIVYSYIVSDDDVTRPAG